MPILPSNPVERRAAQAIFTHALLRWETQAGLFVLVAALIILPGTWKATALLGLLGALGAIRGSLSDARLNAEVAFLELEGEVRAGGLVTPAYQAMLKEALDYQRKIQQLVLGLKEGPLKTQVEMRAFDMAGWIRSMYAFAQGAEELRRQGSFAEELKTLPTEIQTLEWRLGRGGTDNEVLKETLEKKQQTLAALTEVNNTLQRADDELRDTEAAIENIYSQLLRMATASHLPGDAVNRLSQQIDDRAASMKIMADAFASALQSYQ